MALTAKLHTPAWARVLKFHSIWCIRRSVSSGSFPLRNGARSCSMNAIVAEGIAPLI